ncbi:unnamed protein product [Brachionus calyciflorus]|uniref:COMM domain-containing protein 3 n=1 Tax=Brachionus calyciflorus TaxID=104777 RepID=A0A813SZL8_9BILA|nr:unnamed protein product [Brachionus calyciflorus]
MELSSNYLSALKHASNDDLLSFDSFKLLIKTIFDSFIINSKLGKLNPRLDPKILEQINKSEAELKEITAAFYTLLAELARHDVDVNSASTFLEDHGFSNEKIKIFTELYQEKLQIIRLFLSSSTSSFPHIVDVSWRLDYCIKENNLERINEPIYLIELKLEVPGQSNLTSLKFSCTVEQLQDLVFKLKEASKSVEKLAQIS